MAAGMSFTMFKRDVKSAFSRVPIYPGHLWMTGVVWSEKARVLVKPLNHAIWCSEPCLCMAQNVFIGGGDGRQLLFIMVMGFMDDMFGATKKGLQSP